MIKSIPFKKIAAASILLNCFNTFASEIVWGVNKNHLIFNRNFTHYEWTHMGSSLKNIDVNHHGRVWAINHKNKVFTRDGLNGEWQLMTGILKQVSVDDDGRVWGVSTDNTVWTRNGVDGEWEIIPGHLKHVSVGGGHVWGVNRHDEIFYFNFKNARWTLIEGKLKQLSVDSDGTVWGVNRNNLIFTRDGVDGEWEKIPGNLKQVSVSEGHVWGVNSKDQIYTRTDENQNWTKIPGGLSNIAVAVKPQEQCYSGLFGIDAKKKQIINYDIKTGQSTVVKRLSGIRNAGNLSGHDGMLYYVDQDNKDTRDSTIYSLDLTNKEQVAASKTKSYRLYRSVISPDGMSIRATSKTYMYDFDVSTGKKTVLGKFKKYEGEKFKGGDIAYSSDNNTLYLLTYNSLYTVDESSLELTKIGDHGVHWASGLAVSDTGAIYVSGRNKNENVKVYSLNPNTAEATLEFSTLGRVSDLAFVSDAHCSLSR